MSEKTLNFWRHDTVTTLLIDHSGSLMTNDGVGSVLARLCAETLSGALSLIETRHEILGFTTTSWHGGRARTQWARDNNPSNPGRLCDTLHIIYQSFEDSSVDPRPHFSNLFRRDLLKENIDGEAILWAADRLLRQKAKRKLLIFISDGAPVDDSTLMENGNSYLKNHFHEVLNDMKTNNEVELVGVGINHELDAQFDKSIYIQNEIDIKKKFFPFLTNLIQGI